jgi:hypothetical protein
LISQGLDPNKSIDKESQDEKKKSAKEFAID